SRAIVFANGLSLTHNTVILQHVFSRVQLRFDGGAAFRFLIKLLRAFCFVEGIHGLGKSRFYTFHLCSPLASGHVANLGRLKLGYQPWGNPLSKSGVYSGSCCDRSIFVATARINTRLNNGLVRGTTRSTSSL